MHIGWFGRPLRRGVDAVGVALPGREGLPLGHQPVGQPRGTRRRPRPRRAARGRGPAPRRARRRRARSASRCSAAQLGRVAGASAIAGIGGRPGRSSTSRTTSEPEVRHRRVPFTVRGSAVPVRRSSSPESVGRASWRQHGPGRQDRVRVTSLSDTRGPARSPASPPTATCRPGRRSGRGGRSGPRGRRAPSPRRPRAAARSACRGRRTSVARRRRARRRARSAPSCRSCRWRSAAAPRRQWNAAGTMYAGQRRAQPLPQDVGVERPSDRSRRPPGACSGPARSATTTAPSRTPGTRSRAFSISPISIRKPRILTWVSRRPRNSSLPSGQPAAVVAAPVEPLARAVRVGQEGRRVRSGSLT